MLVRRLYLATTVHEVMWVFCTASAEDSYYLMVCPGSAWLVELRANPSAPFLPPRLPYQHGQGWLASQRRKREADETEQPLLVASHLVYNNEG